MANLGPILSLAASLTSTLIFTGMAVTGIVRGRLKVESNQPWVIFRDHPIKFTSIVLLEIGFASSFAVALVRVVTVLLK